MCQREEGLRRVVRRIKKMTLSTKNLRLREGDTAVEPEYDTQSEEDFIPSQEPTSGEAVTIPVYVISAPPEAITQEPAVFGLTKRFRRLTNRFLRDRTEERIVRYRRVGSP